MYPLAEDVLIFLGKTAQEGQDVEIVTAHLNTAMMLVRAYTRGNGFSEDGPTEDLAAVIVSCAARLNANPTHQTANTVSVDDGSWRQSPGIFKG